MESKWRVKLARLGSKRRTAVRRRGASGGRRLGRLAGARLAAAARPAPYHTNKIYLMDNRPDDGMPIEIFHFTMRLLMT